ncbi:hypothetical protein BsWGS_20662 [Bradybaena similaris]
MNRGHCFKQQFWEIQYTGNSDTITVSIIRFVTLQTGLEILHLECKQSRFIFKITIIQCIVQVKGHSQKPHVHRTKKFYSNVYMWASISSCRTDTNNIAAYTGQRGFALWLDETRLDVEFYGWMKQG